MEIYGDGIHDDTNAIQYLLDNNQVVNLPFPQKYYLISRPLKLRSNQTLRLDSFAAVKLAAKSSCLMVSCEHCNNVVLEGGLWDMNNMEQNPNPLWTGSFGEVKHDDMDDRYLGVAMRFFDVTNLTIKNLTVKDPVTFGIQITKAYQFTVDNITFDYNQGNPILGTMDGVHIESGCRYGRITNLKGKTYDDLLAINADDFYYGDISDISVDGIYAEGAHSAIRMLASQSTIERISINNIFGSFYQYCIGITKYYHIGDKSYKGKFDQITISNVYARKHFRYPDFYTAESFVYPFIFIERELEIKNLTIRDLHRRETETDIDTVFIDIDTVIENLTITDCSYENGVGNAPFLTVKGDVKNMNFNNIKLYGDNIKLI
ncbi:MAG: glycosyl hydrolase family 28 protein [Eubacteriales bacterium]|nr:glycosyl hydrolase family 28 protein [Eubacteriales bacterium]MDD4475762.1 glycosyl hydrolase family 28 protein [Eubacteriales bacterium]